MANCSQTNNTTIIGTSAVSYDSTPLPCTDVKACDDLNTILTKFDNVICSAINSVNILSEEVMNITEDLMIIGEEIENINNQLFICCPICDFTITATELPVCEFTASATELPTCNFTGSVNQVPDSTTTTTSSSSTSTSTSTTTTTTCPCYTWDIDATAPDVAAGLNLAYINCNGDPTNEEIIGGRPFTRCVQSGSTPTLTRDDSAPLEGSTVTITSDCCTSPPPISSTTTTTTSNTFGPLIVQNDSVNLTVNSVTALFAFISIPPTPPTTITTGTHEALVNAITVNVTSNIAPNCMKLYIGGSFIQQVTIVGTGAHQFDPLIVADTIEVKIVINDFACIESE